MKSICKDCKHCSFYETTNIDTVDSRGLKINWFVETDFLCNMTKVTMMDVQKCTGFEECESNERKG